MRCLISVIMAGQRKRQPARDRNTSYPALATAWADGARIGHDRRMDAAGGDVVIRLAHDEALTRGCAWPAGQSLLQDRHPESGMRGRSERHHTALARALIKILAGYRSTMRTLLPARPGPGR